jgi:hypothetical protein
LGQILSNSQQDLGSKVHLPRIADRGSQKKNPFKTDDHDQTVVDVDKKPMIDHLAKGDTRLS